jgi:hypothetical protein
MGEAEVRVKIPIEMLEKAKIKPRRRTRKWRDEVSSERSSLSGSP